MHLGKYEVVGLSQSHTEGESVEWDRSCSHSCDRAQVSLTGKTDGSMSVSDLNTLRLHMPLVGHENAITSVTVYDGGRLVTSSSTDKTLRTWYV